jgi:hypothetical protein
VLTKSTARKFDQYAEKFCASTAAKAGSPHSTLVPLERTTTSLGGYGDSFRQHAVESRRHREQGATINAREELERYLSAPLHVPQEDIVYNPLDWWRVSICNDVHSGLF